MIISTLFEIIFTKISFKSGLLSFFLNNVFLKRHKNP